MKRQISMFVTVVSAATCALLMGCAPDAPPPEVERSEAPIQVSSESAQPTPTLQPSQQAPEPTTEAGAPAVGDPAAENPEELVRKQRPLVRTPQDRARQLRLHPGAAATRKSVRPHGDAGDAAPRQDDTGEPPRIVAVEPNFDFGAVPQGQEVVHTFVLKNEGTGMLVIERADAG